MRTLLAILMVMALTVSATSAFAFTGEDVVGFFDRSVLTRLNGNDNGPVFADKRSFSNDNGFPSVNIFRMLEAPVGSWDAALMRVSADCQTGKTKLGVDPVLRIVGSTHLKQIHGDPSKIHWESVTPDNFLDIAYKYLCSGH